MSSPDCPMFANIAGSALARRLRAGATRLLSEGVIIVLVIGAIVVVEAAIMTLGVRPA